MYMDKKVRFEWSPYIDIDNLDTTNNTGVFSLEVKIQYSIERVELRMKCKITYD